MKYIKLFVLFFLLMVPAMAFLDSLDSSITMDKAYWIKNITHNFGAAVVWTVVMTIYGRWKDKRQKVEG